MVNRLDKNTTYEEVLNSFHSTFQDKTILPPTLEKEWFLKAVGKYSFEINPIHYDNKIAEFDSVLDRYTIDTLGLMMKKFYQQRELSKVNKRISIVGKDISINSGMSSSKYAENEVKLASEELDDMLYKQTPSAYN